MTEGNAVAMTSSKASIGQEPIQKDCEELEGNNEERRKHIKNNAEDKKLRGKNGMDEQEGTTISSCKFQPANSNTATCASAHSLGLAKDKFEDQFIEGGDKEIRSGRAPVMCTKDKFHKGPTMQKSGHAEARILDALGDKTGVKIVFKIDWRDGNNKKSNFPCPACQRLMCIAMKECKHEIWLCNNANKPKKLTEDDCELNKKGIPTRKAQRLLQKKLR